MTGRGKITEGLWLATDRPQRADKLAFNAQGTLLAVAWPDADYAIVLDVATDREVARVTELWLRDYHTFEFFGDKLLGLADSGIVCWDVRSGTLETLWAKNGVTPLSATISPDGRQLAIGIVGGFILYDLVDKRSRRLQTLFESRCYRATFSPGGRYVAAQLSLDSVLSLVVVWDTATGRRWRTFPGASYPEPMAFRGDTLALAIGSSQIELFEPDQGEDPVATYAVAGMACALQFRNGGDVLAIAAGYGGSLTLVETATGQVRGQVAPPGNREIELAQPNADWSMIASAADGGILLWGTGLA
jgi:WD40 repeat protein